MVGASPSFSDVHILRVLFLLFKEKFIGRKKLLQNLEIGEGSIRTILKKLKEEGLINSSKKGHYLTRKGYNKIYKILKKFSFPKEISSEIIPGRKVFLVVHNSASKVKKGIEERDISIKAGGKGAIILKFQKNKLKLPVPKTKFKDKNLLSEIMKNFNLKEGDVVVISFGDTVESAENSAIAIALNLIK